jgi:hypothetical protein
MQQHQTLNTQFLSAPPQLTEHQKWNFPRSSDMDGSNRTVDHGYGFIDFEKEDAAIDVEILRASRSTTQASSSTDLTTQYELSEEESFYEDQDKKLVVYAYDNMETRLSVRSFDTFLRSQLQNNSKQLRVCLRGFRIVQDDCNGEYAEYQVQVTYELQDYFVWRRYSDFARLAESCSEYCRCSHSHTLLDWFLDYVSGASSAKEESKKRLRQLRNTLSAWADVKDNTTWGRCLDVHHLLLMTRLLGVFIENLLYEIHSPRIIIEFALADYACRI